MFDISPVQIIIVLAIALLVFGPKRLPEMGRGLGKGVRDFRDGISGSSPTQEAKRSDPAAPPAADASTNQKPI